MVRMEKQYGVVGALQISVLEDFMYQAAGGIASFSCLSFRLDGGEGSDMKGTLDGVLMCISQRAHQRYRGCLNMLEMETRVYIGFVQSFLDFKPAVLVLDQYSDFIIKFVL